MKIKSSQINKLTESAREMVQKIVDTIESGGILNPSDFGLLGFSFNCLREKDISEAFKTTDRTIRNWVKEGCPKRPDGYYDLYQVHDWLLCRVIQKAAPDSDNLKDQKTIKEIEVLEKRAEKMDFEMQKLLDSTVPKETHENVKTAIIESFTGYLRNSLKSNISTIRAVPDADANDMIDQFCIDLTRHMASSAKQVERV